MNTYLRPVRTHAYIVSSQSTMLNGLYKCMFMLCKTGQRRDSKMAPGPALHEMLLLTSTHLDLRPARTYLVQADT